MSIPVSNAFCEIIFSFSHVLTDDKKKLSVNLMKAELQMKILE